MSGTIKLFTAAFTVSFLGTLPIGTLNTNVANYATKGNLTGAIEFGVGAILIEVLIVRLSVFLVDKLNRLKQLTVCLQVLMCVVILLLAFRSLEAAYHMIDFQDSLPYISMYPFYSGLALSLLNPLHLPFWTAWTNVLKGKGILTGNRSAYFIYMSAIGAGTCIAFIIYALAGAVLENTLKSRHILIDWILGLTLATTGLIQAFKLVTRPSAPPLPPATPITPINPTGPATPVTPNARSIS